MHQLNLQLVIRHKLETGALPRNSIPRVWGGPGNGETCDACESVITLPRDSEGRIGRQAPAVSGFGTTPRTHVASAYRRVERGAE
jgi:hypothetical protein